MAIKKTVVALSEQDLNDARELAELQGINVNRAIQYAINDSLTIHREVARGSAILVRRRGRYARSIDFFRRR